MACLNSVPATAATVTLSQAVHFTASDGSDVVAAAGSYLVDLAGSHMSLKAEGQAPLLFDAQPTPHSVTIETPVAVTTQDENGDVVHVVLLLPGGQAFAVPGSLSGTRPRGSGVAVPTSSQIQAAMQMAQSPVRRDHRGEGIPAPPPPSQPPSPGFGVSPPGKLGPGLTMFHLLELQTIPSTFVQGDTLKDFILVYRCWIDRQPCTAAQDRINVVWDIRYGNDGVASVRGQILYGAGRDNCPLDVVGKYGSRVGCLNSALASDKGYAGGRKVIGLQTMFSTMLSSGSERVSQDFLVEMTQPRPKMKIGRPRVRDHR
jgi:hypothetical protein